MHLNFKGALLLSPSAFCTTSDLGRQQTQLRSLGALNGYLLMLTSPSGTTPMPLIAPVSEPREAGDLAVLRQATRDIRTQGQNHGSHAVFPPTVDFPESLH